MTQVDGPGLTAQLDLEHPWPGLESYSESSRAFFHGRSEEMDELSRRIADEAVCVLFGKSGLGKTSLLKAGVFPLLRDRSLLPVFIRLQLRPRSKPLLEQVHDSLLAELTAREIEHPPRAPDETLWEYLHRTGLEFWTKKNRLVRPILVLDQFEELFTLGRALPDAVAQFRYALADLAENRVPARVAERLDAQPEGTVLPGNGTPPDTNPLDVGAMPYKIVISLREDFLADLEDWRSVMPSLRRNRMRLLPMTARQALRAVRNEHTQRLVTERVAARIVERLSRTASACTSLRAPPRRGRQLGPAGGNAAAVSAAPRPSGESAASVEPALLSLFCRGVNEHRVRAKKPRLDEELLEGAQDTVVAEFYWNSVRDQPRRVRAFIGAHLVTEHGFRNNYAVDEAVGQGFVTDEELQALVKRRLLRLDQQLGIQRIELTHDLLTQAVLERRNADRQRRKWMRLLCGVAGLLGTAAAAFLLLWWGARDDRERFRAQEYAALAKSLGHVDPTKALLVALDGARLRKAQHTRSALLEASRFAWPVAMLGRKELLQGKESGSAEAIAMNGDGTLLAVAAGEERSVMAGEEEDGPEGEWEVSLWDLTTRKPSAKWDRPLKVKPGTAMAFSPGHDVLALASSSSIHLVSLASAGVEAEPPLPSDAGSRSPGRQVVFSPDGKWLGWWPHVRDGREHIGLASLKSPETSPVLVPAGRVERFAVLGNAERIIVVKKAPTSHSAEVLTRKDDGTYQSEPLPLNCGGLSAESASPGGRFLSVSYDARLCRYDAASGRWWTGREEKWPTDDVVWSAAGRGRVRISQRAGVMVGDVSHVRGARVETSDDGRPLVAVDERETRVALISENRLGRRSVMLYSVGPRKPLLSRLPAHVHVATSKRWVALTQWQTDSRSAPEVDLFRLDGSAGMGFDTDVRFELPPGEVRRLLSANDSLIVEMDLGGSSSHPRTLVFDVSRGGAPTIAREGTARVVGPSGRLVAIERDGNVGTAPSMDLYRTRDGAQVDSFPRQGRGAAGAYWLSGSGRALATTTRTGDDSRDLAVYALDSSEERFVRRGALHHVSLESSIDVRDDAGAIAEGRGEATLIWRVTESGVTEARDAGGAERQVEPTRARCASPLFSEVGVKVVKDSGRVEGAQQIQVVNRVRNERLSDRAVWSLGCAFAPSARWLASWSLRSLHMFNSGKARAVKRKDLAGVRGVAFSADEQSFVAWTRTELRVFRLDDGDPLTFPVEGIASASFEAGDSILRVRWSDPSATLLVPLEASLLERFGEWLVGGLTDAERCRRWRDGKACGHSANRPPLAPASTAFH